MNGRPQEVQISCTWQQ